jgi:hypothetical protein
LAKKKLFNRMLWLNKATIDVQLEAQRLVVKISPYHVVAGVIYYHLEVCSSLPIVDELTI